MADTETVAWLPGMAGPSVATPAAAPASGSYQQTIPPRSSLARIELVCWLLRRLGRLHLRDAAATPALRRRLARIDRLVFHPPRWLRPLTIDLDGVPCEWIGVPGSGAERVVLYLHGGGFAFHMPRGYRSFAARLARALRARVLLPDYRLSPEHCFPAAPDDALSTYRSLLAQGLPAERIVVAGDSAGGHLTLGLLQRLKREGLPQPACAIALSPITDSALSGRSMTTHAAIDPMLDTPSLHVMREMVYPPGLALDPVASPLHGDFEGLAPTLILCGTREILLDDACRYAQHAHAAGAPVCLEVWEEMPHVFPLLAQLRESRAALSHMAHFVDATLG